jgi:restriction endonuclease S subunit
LNGNVVIASSIHENKVLSDDLIRIAPKAGADLRSGYLYVALSHPVLGRPLVKALAYGSSIPHIDVHDLNNLEIIRLSDDTEQRIAEFAEDSARLYATADRMERELSREAAHIIGGFINSDSGNIKRGNLKLVS